MSRFCALFNRLAFNSSQKKSNYKTTQQWTPLNFYSSSLAPISFWPLARAASCKPQTASSKILASSLILAAQIPFSLMIKLESSSWFLNARTSPKRDFRFARQLKTHMWIAPIACQSSTAPILANSKAKFMTLSLVSN